MRLASSPVRSLCAAAAGAMLALCSQSAHAAFASDITLRLIAPGGINNGSTIDPTPVSAQQTVALADLVNGVHAADGGAIGSGWMLDGEKVFFEEDSIKLRIGVGNDTTGGVYTTGYLGLGVSNHALYQFDGLSIVGKTIVGVSLYAWDGFGTTDAGSGSGLGNPAVLGSLAHFIDSDTVTFDLDTLEIAQRIAGSSNNFAEFRIQLITRDNGTGGPGGPGNDLPEPATLALFAVAALGARAARRRA
ncbi:PEP-CTERM sorting domain-containing protein [Roseateles sp.]|uniref:PEP-CTERM sorting domain-containing protein n=1 Tax=Roseateles sp. TaxID=1971397 RepID=UPI0025F7FBE9|nr:PEP-CTERM sorting domain-containing protein [Roseateles sp.]MBV8037267.1 PEP-CTERM sorting domain-containing protein [Roseateles sp.]